MIVIRIGIWDDAFAYIALDSSTNRIVVHLSGCVASDLRVRCMLKLLVTGFRYLPFVERTP